MSEFRQDPVSGDWVILAAGRAKRPEELIKRRELRRPSPRRGCPFEDLQKSGNWPPIKLYPSPKHWKIAVIRNKYPALTHVGGCATDLSRGLYHAKSGVGDHELVITRDHYKSFADLDAKSAGALFAVFGERHRAFAKDDCNAYISTFFNWGRSAGASLWHPHYQILALPIVPPHNARSIHGAERYFRKYHHCVRCDVIAAERKAKSRIVAENRSAIAIAPYASKRPFELSILPTRHAAHFTKTPRAVVYDMAVLTQFCLRRMQKYLHDPDLNFFIHDAPTDGGQYAYHHWHVEVVPANVVSPPGGFELSTIMNINVIEPETAAAVLQGSSSAARKKT